MNNGSPPLISVATLTYKNYHRLFETISSVLSQDYSNIEYIISDDGSGDFPTEKVLEYIKTYKRDNIKNFELIVNDDNVGTVKHLNNVLKKCEGEYIFDLASEDLFSSNHIVSEIVEHFQNSDCDVLIASRAVYTGSEITSLVPHKCDWEHIKSLDTAKKRYSAFMLTQHFDAFIGANVFYKKETIKKHGYFDEQYVLLEDAPMIGEFLWEDKVDIIPEIIGVIYEGENGVSTSKRKNAVLEKDISYFNQFGKLKHYEELDHRVKKHIDFGIERAKAKNKLQLALICFKYIPQIVDYGSFCLGRTISGFKDKEYINSLNIENCSLLK